MLYRMRLRKILNGLGRHGVLIRWTCSLFTGTRIWISDPTGYPICMNPGTAKAHLRQLEREVWGG